MNRNQKRRVACCHTRVVSHICVFRIMLRQRPLHFVSSRFSCRCYSSELPAPRLNLRGISENAKQKAHNAHIRKAPVAPKDVQKITDAYTSWRTLQTQLNELLNQRSTLGERLQKAPPAEKAEMLQAASTLKQQVKELTALVDSAEEQCMGLARLLPNDTHPDVPIGPEPSAKTISTHGPPLVSADPRRDHVGICTQFDWVDLAAGATSTGSSFYFLKNQGALLELALTNYALSKAIAKGFTPMLTPDVVKADIAARCGFQPRDDEQGPSHMYTVQTHPSSPSLVLSGTAEIPIGGSLANKVFSSLSLPLRIVGYGHAFRQEAGARSADTRGLYRVHQFSKVELFAVTSEDESEGMMEELLELQKDILEGLGLSFRYLSPFLRFIFTPGPFNLRLCLSGSSTCQVKNSGQVHIANMTSKRGCLGGGHGARSPPFQTVQTSRLGDFSFGINPKGTRPPPTPWANSPSLTHSMVRQLPSLGSLSLFWKTGLYWTRQGRSPKSHCQVHFGSFG